VLLQSGIQIGGILRDGVSVCQRENRMDITVPLFHRVNGDSVRVDFPEVAAEFGITEITE
jgi:hypothetical protein